MANNSTKYISLNRLNNFLDNLKETFAEKIHTHKVSDLSDYVVDTELSSGSTNPVQNKVIDSEFESVAMAMGALESAIDEKADEVHSHIISDVTDLQAALDNKSNTLHNHTVTDITDLTVTATELNYMNGATSNVQVQIDTLDEDKVAYTDSPVFAADDSVDTTLEVINADTLGGMTPEYFATAEMVNNLTYSDVGAAPAGYGLGKTTPRYASDLNAAITDGWYYTNTNTANVPQNRFYYSSVLVLARTSTQIAQLLTSISYSVQMMRYTQDGGATWVEEWVNPPMSFGVEYRTTERHNGKPVYTKLVNVGSLTNAGKIKVSVSNSFKIIRCNGYCKAGAGYNVTLPYKVDNSEISCAAVSNDIYLYTNFDCSSYTGYVTIWYTKD